MQRRPTDCGVSLSVIYKPRELGGPGPLGDVAPNKKKYDMIRYLLTAIGLSPGGSTHLHTNNT